MRRTSPRFGFVRLAARLVIGAALLALPFSQATALTTYTTRASFNAALGSAVTQNFESYTSNAPFHTTPVDVGDFSLSMLGTPDVASNFIDASPPNSAETSVFGNTNMAVATMASPDADLVFSFDFPITAFGADFRSFNDIYARTQLVIDGEIITPPVAPSSGLLTFFGVWSETPFTSVVLEGVAAGDVYGIDNVSYIPEPSTALLLAAGFAAIALARRRRLH